MAYKLRKLCKPESKNDFDAASLAVPMAIAKKMPDDIEFEPELTEDGILYRPVHTAITEGTQIPSWMKTDKEGKTKTTTTASK